MVCAPFCPAKVGITSLTLVAASDLRCKCFCCGGGSLTGEPEKTGEAGPVGDIVQLGYGHAVSGAAGFARWRHRRPPIGEARSDAVAAADRSTTG